MLPKSLAPIVALAVALPAAPTPGAGVQERDATSLLARVDLIAQEAIAGSGASALVVMVDVGGEPLLARGYGGAREDAAGFAFRAGALGEVFTAVCLLQLAHEGALDLDADVSTFLPGLAREGVTIPVRRLLSHTSGLPSDDAFLHSLAARRRAAANPGQGAREAAAQTPPAADEELAELVAVLAGLELESEPGSCFSYEHTNHIVAAAVLETATGEPLLRCFAERIFAPLEMSSTRAREDGPPIVSEEVVTQIRGGREMQIPAHAELFDEELLCSSAGDLVRFTRALAERELLDDASYRALTEPARLADGSEADMGLGLGRSLLEDAPNVACGGVLAGGSVQLAYYPEQDMTIAVLADDADTRVQRVERRVARAVLDLPEPGVHDWPLSRRELARYVGDYQIGCTRLEVRAPDDHLTLAWEDRPALRLLHQGKHGFVAGADPEIRLLFELEGEQASSFELDDHGRLSIARRFGR